ncbi:MAG TPA: beta-ketoacyl-ACP synthase [Acetobacteraceae bacterium]|nr:beta-ketoacyl-ACP synthase [Acetobacteraceae bacterium]
MSGRRPVVVVTGVGVVTPLGIGRADNWAALTAGRSGIRRITRFPTEGCRTTIAGAVEFLPESGAPSPVLTEALAMLAAEEAIAGAGIGRRGAFPGPLFLGTPPVELDWRQRLALAQAGGDTAGGYAAMIAAARGRTDLYEMALFGGIAHHLADRLGTRGAPIALTTACATGATAIQMGVEAIQRGETDAAIAIGADGSVNTESLIRFSLLSALSTRNDDPEAAPRPFEKNRDGFVMAEGAGALVLERLEAAQARGARILAVMSGCGERADNFHRTRSSPDGGAIIGAIRNALDDAGLRPEQIGYINAHGTGTPENDKMETLGVTAVFGAHAASVPISSNKSMIGHTLSAAGAIEAVFTIETILHQRLPPTINHDEPDPAIPLDVVPNVARDAPVAHAMSNSFGFGGQNTCLVFSAPG